MITLFKSIESGKIEDACYWVTECIISGYTIEIFDKLRSQAKINHDMLKIKNVDYKLGDGSHGWDKNFLFDSIIVSAATEKIPHKLLESLKKYGNLIIPKKYPSDNQ